MHSFCPYTKNIRCIFPQKPQLYLCNGLLENYYCIEMLSIAQVCNMKASYWSKQKYLTYALIVIFFVFNELCTIIFNYEFGRQHILLIFLTV